MKRELSDIALLSSFSSVVSLATEMLSSATDLGGCLAGWGHCFVRVCPLTCSASRGWAPPHASPVLGGGAAVLPGVVSALGTVVLSSACLHDSGVIVTEVNVEENELGLISCYFFLFPSLLLTLCRYRKKSTVVESFSSLLSRGSLEQMTEGKSHLKDYIFFFLWKIKTGSCS